MWIDVSTTDIAERSFLDVAQKLSIAAQTWEDARIGISNLKHPWLLILDNADTPDTDYQNYFPDSPIGVVMLTSRNDECEKYATTKSIRLGGLDDVEAQELLLKAIRLLQNTRDEYKDDATVVARLLQSHPLALVQAGAYISRGYCSLAEYPRIYEQQRRHLLSFRSKQAQSRYGDVYATFEVSIAMLEVTQTESAQDALQLLPLLAICRPNRLPSVLFQAAWAGVKKVPTDTSDDDTDDEMMLLTPWHIGHVPPFLDLRSNTWNSFRLTDAVSVLKAFALISTDSENNIIYISMHPLVHAWARDRQSIAELHQSWLRMGCIAAFAEDQKFLSQEHRRSFQPHIEALVEWDFATIFAAESPVLITRILTHYGWYLRNMRADAKVSVLTQSIFRYLGLSPSKVEPKWIGLYDLVARNLLRQHKTKEALEIQKQIVNIKKDMLPGEHPDLMTSLYELAKVYTDNDQLQEAVPLIECVFRIQERILPKDHPDVLTSQHLLARIYTKNGQTLEGIQLLEEMVRIEEQKLPEDHSDRLATQEELASAYLHNGQIREAIRLFEQVVRVQDRTLAEEHPERLSSRHQLAYAYSQNGQIREAAALFEQVVRIRERTLAEDHRDRLVSQWSLAVMLAELGEVSRACQMMRKVTEQMTNIYNEEHPTRRDAEDWLEKIEAKLENEASGSIHASNTLQLNSNEDTTPVRLQKARASTWWRRAIAPLRRNTPATVLKRNAHHA